MPSENHSDFNPVLGVQLLAAARTQDRAAVQALLLRNDVDINFVGTDKLNVLMISVVKGDHAAVTALTARSDLRINVQTNGGLSALMLASIFERPEMVQTMLTRADLLINDANSTGNTALMLAATRGDVQVMELFKIRADVDVNAANRQGATALMLACIAGKPDAVECLKGFEGIDLDAGDDTQCTALMHAVVHRFGNIVDSLKDCADINAKDNAQWTALMYAAVVVDPLILRSLLEVEHLELDTVNKGEGKSALMIAAQRGHPLPVKQLIDAGADITLIATDGRTAEEIARDAGHIDVADLLALHARLVDPASSMLTATPGDEDDHLDIPELLSLDAADDDRLLDSAFAEQESSTGGNAEPLVWDSL